MVTHRGSWTLGDRAEDILRTLPVTVRAGHRRAHRTARLPARGRACSTSAASGRPASGAGRAAPATVTPSPPTGPPPATCPASWSPASGRCCSGCTGSRPRASTTRSPPPPAPPHPLPSPRPSRRRRPQRPPRPRAAGGRRAALARRDLHAHTVHSDGAHTIDELAAPGRRPGPGLPRRHRPQHGQPPPVAARVGPPVRHHAAARPGGDHRPGTRQRVRPGRLDRLPATGRRVARYRRAGGRAAVGQPPARRGLRLAAAGDHPHPAGRGVALRLVGPHLGRAAGVGRRPGAPDVVPDRRQRLPPARRGRAARRADHLGARRRRPGRRGVGTRRAAPPAAPRSPPAPTRRCCCGSATNCSPSTRTARCSAIPTAATGWSAATGACSRPPTGCTSWSPTAWR